MEFITAEQFLEQDKEVQKIFLEWWKSNLNGLDLIDYIGRSKAYKKLFPSLVRRTALDCFEIGIEIIPLLTEGQLRKFIEDKTGCSLNVRWSCWSRDKGVETFDYEFSFSSWEGYAFEHKNFKIDKCPNIFQAFWLVALKVAKEIIS